MNTKKVKYLLILGAIALSCSCEQNQKTQNQEDDVVAIDHKNEFESYQMIEGSVKGHWIKENNPHIITGPTNVNLGDTLEIDSGVIVILESPLQIFSGAVLKLNGSSNDPVALVDKYPFRYFGILEIAGNIEAKNSIVSSSIYFVVRDTIPRLNFNNVTWLNANISWDLIPRLMNGHFKSTDQNSITPYVNINNSIIYASPVGLPTSGNVSYYWMHTRAGVINTDSIIINKSCLNDYSRKHNLNINTIYNSDAKEFEYTEIKGDYLLDQAAFKNYLPSDSLSNTGIDTVNIIDMNTHEYLYDLHLENENACGQYGAYN